MPDRADEWRRDTWPARRLTGENSRPDLVQGWGRGHKLWERRIAVDVIYIFLAFYMALYVYGIVFSIVGARGLIWLEEGGSSTNNRRFAIQFATIPLSVILFASLLLDELLARGLAQDIESQSLNYLNTLAFCLYQFLNSIGFDTLASFGRAPDLGITHEPSLHLGSLLIFSLNIFGSIAGLNLVLLAARSYRRHSAVT